MKNEETSASSRAADTRFLHSARSRYLLAVVAGLVLAAAFLEIGVAGFAWVAPGLILATAHGKTGGAAFRIGYFAGLAFHLAGLYWLLLIPVKGYPILGWVSLSAFLALFPATWVWLTVKMAPFLSTGLQPGGRLAKEAAAASAASLSRDKALETASATSRLDTGLKPGANESERVLGHAGWLARTGWALFGAAAWVALEMTQARLFSGFPWNFLGTSQYQMLPLIQIASVTGVYGVSFVVVWFSLSLYSAVIAIVRQPTVRYAWLGEVILPLAVSMALFVFGLGRLREPTGGGEHLRVTFVQPSIPQTMIWDEKENDSRFQQLLGLTRDALTNKTDLLLWPEAAVPKMIRYDEATFRAITGLARSNEVWMVSGCDDASPRLSSTNPDEADYFNGSFLISASGEVKSVYHKRHLVIFGEYVPLIRWLPFVKWFTPITGGFTSGDKLVPFELERWGERPREPQPDLNGGSSVASPHQTVKTATLICFEDVFPHVAREYVDDDTDFLINLTNDGWFGEGAEQWQHAASAVFRAVENGLPLARSCNNGLTCWIDSRGRLRDILRDKKGSIYGAGVMTAQIPVLAAGAKRAPTFYNAYGDWFGWSCVAVALIAGLSRSRQRTC